MRGWKQEWDRERFSDREKQDLAARLRQAAEQEESMDNKSKKRIFRLGRGAAVAVAAALMLTVGAMAAAANGTWGRTVPLLLPGGGDPVGEDHL